MPTHAILRGALALVVVAAIATQAVYSFGTLHAPIVNFFSYFTIQTNLIVVAALLRPRNAVLRGAATLYIVIVGIVFSLLLAHLPESRDTTIPWVNVVLHDVTPIALAVDWIVDPAPLSG